MPQGRYRPELPESEWITKDEHRASGSRLDLRVTHFAAPGLVTHCR
jgi:hypothetical protein